MPVNVLHGKYLCIILIIAMSFPAIAQRLRVETYSDSTRYKKHYSHIIKAATINDSLHMFIAGNFTDKLSVNSEVSGHKIYDTTLIVNKKGRTPGSGDNILLTDFTVIPATEFQYASGTGVYYPDGPDDEGYPFLGFYNRYTFEIDSLVYFNLSYAGVEQSHATGLRIKYSRDEGAYYVLTFQKHK